MVEYTLAHVGINAANAEEARQGAAMFEALFGLTAKEGNSSVFAGKAVELMKQPYLGRNGHIAIGTPDVPAAVQDLEQRGFSVRPDTAKYRKDGTLNAIYLQQEVCGFAIHLMCNAK